MFGQVWSMKLLTLAVLTVATAMLVVACSSGDEDTAAPAAPAAPAAATAAPAAPTAVPAPLEPAAVRLVTAFEPPSTEGNETRHIGQTTVWQMKAMYEYLIDSSPDDDKLLPGLALEWAVEDGPQVRFKLREGVPFHGDWGEFTSADVVKTLTNHQRDDSLHGEVKYFQSVTPEAIPNGDHEVVIKLSRNDSNFFAQFSRLQGGFEIISKAHLESAGDPVVIGTDAPIAGTGPYQYKERAQGQNIVFEKVSDHWRLNPDFQEIEIKFITEASTRMAALLAGEVHLTNLPEDQLVQTVAKGMKVVRGNVTALRAFAQFRGQYELESSAKSAGYQDTGSPFLNVKVRQALNRAIDRDEINNAFFGGKGQTMHVNHLNEGRPGWNPRWETDFPSKYGFDPAAAKALLAEAGYNAGNPLEIDAHVAPISRYAGADDIMEIMIAYWQDIGVKVNQYTEDNTIRRAKGRAFEYTREIAMGGTSSNITIGPKVYNTSFPPRGGGVEILESSKIMGEFMQTLEPKRADDLARQMGNIFFDEFISIPLFWLPAEAVINPEVVAGWNWPGSITGTWTHLENVKAVMK